jgi:hypothetical protein
MTTEQDLIAREIQAQPSDHCYVILQDHGPSNGGWGPAALRIPSLGMGFGPLVYTGSDENTIEKLGLAAHKLAQETGKPTILARFHAREDVSMIGGSS